MFAARLDGGGGDLRAPDGGIFRQQGGQVAENWVDGLGRLLGGTMSGVTSRAAIHVINRQAEELCQPFYSFAARLWRLTLRDAVDGRLRHASLPRKGVRILSGVGHEACQNVTDCHVSSIRHRIIQKCIDMAIHVRIMKRMDTKSIIAEIRAHGLSQLEIERRTGIRQPTISRWENSGAPDSADDALKLLALRNDLAAQAKRNASRAQIKAAA